MVAAVVTEGSESLGLTIVVRRGDDVQIVRSKDEPQQVVARGPLHYLQYLDLYLSRMQRICPISIFELAFGLD